MSNPSRMSWTARTPILRRIVPPREPSMRYMDRQDRRAAIRSRMLAVFTVAAGLAYIVWLFVHRSPHHPWMVAAFLAAESGCLLLFVSASFSVWALRFKPPEGLPIQTAASVDVLVTVCGEPLPVVNATLGAVADIDWPGPLRVIVLDDGGAPDVRKVAEARGFTYRSRVHDDVSRDRAKAGNLNFGLDLSAGEYVLVLDADQVPQRWILRAMAGYLRFKDVAFVQSRQMFFVPEGDPFFNLDRVFYEAVQLGYDNRDLALSCGSGVLYRRAALIENGGFSDWNVVEDLTTSYDLHSRGWRSFYYPYAVTTGLAPDHIWGVYRQRGQWALDTMRLFFWDNPLLKRGLPWRGRMSYLLIPFAYLIAAFVLPFFFVIPLWGYLTGGSVLTGHELEFVIVRGIYFAAMAFALRTLFRRHQAGRQFQMLAGLFPVYLAGTARALVYPPARHPEYAANNALREKRSTPAIVAILPQVFLIAANAILPFYALATGSAPPRLVLSNALISAVAIWSLLPTVFAALGTKSWDDRKNPYALHGQPANASS